MSVLDGYNKYKRYIKTNDGYKLCSQWTSSNTVQMDDGNTLQTNLGAINGITDSLTATSSNIAASAAAVKALNDSLLDKTYPVGSIYMSVNNTNPSTLFGGTWVAWGSGRVPVGVNASDSNFSTVEKTGGASTVKLTTSQMPKHSHGATNFIINSTEGFKINVGSGSGIVSHGSMFVTEVSGGGSAHNNLQPYITCYMWKRVA